MLKRLKLLVVISLRRRDDIGIRVSPSITRAGGIAVLIVDPSSCVCPGCASAFARLTVVGALS